MWFTPRSSSVASTSSARSWRMPPRAAAPKITLVLSCPVRPNGAVGSWVVMARPYDLATEAKSALDSHLGARLSENLRRVSIETTRGSGMLTGEQYKETLFDGRAVFFGGKRVDDLPAHPILGPSVENVAQGYDWCTAHAVDGVSPLAGVPSSAEELREKVEVVHQ